MNLFVVPEDHLEIEVWVSLVPPNPLPFHFHVLFVALLLSFQLVLWDEFEQELLVRLQVVEGVLVLLDVAFDVRDPLV